MANEPKTDQLRISRLVERDFGCVHEIDMQPTGRSLVIVRGPNEAGKTTAAIDAIRVALGGARAAPDVPIRKGQNNAAIEMTLADSKGDRFRIGVTFDAKGRTLILEDVAGGKPARLPRAQSHIDELVGALTFDPLSFQRASPEQQYAMVLEAAGMAKEHAALLMRRDGAKEARREAGRDVRNLEGRLAEYADVPKEPLERIDASAIEAKLHETQAAHQQVMHAQAAIEEKEKQRGRATQLIATAKQIIEEQTAVIEQEQARIAAIPEHIAELEREAEASAADANPTVVMAKLTAAQETNATVDKQEARESLWDSLTNTRDTVEHEQETIDEVAKLIGELLSVSDLSKRIPGLSLTDSKVQHNGLPLSQASGMRKLESSALIGMAMNRKLAVMCVDEGDRLDQESIDRLAKIADENGQQVWMTAVYANSDQADVFEMRDGEIVGEAT